MLHPKMADLAPCRNLSIKMCVRSTYTIKQTDYNDSKACTNYSVGNVQMNIQSLCKLMSLGTIDFINIREGGSHSIFRDDTGFFGFWSFSGV